MFIRGRRPIGRTPVLQAGDPGSNPGGSICVGRHGCARLAVNQLLNRIGGSTPSRHIDGSTVLLCRD